MSGSFNGIDPYKEIERLKFSLNEKREALTRIQQIIWQGISEIYNEKDYYHFNHSLRVSALLTIIVNNCLSKYATNVRDIQVLDKEKEKAFLKNLGDFHDIGKVGIGNELLFSEPLLGVFYYQVPGFLDYINKHAEWGSKYFATYKIDDMDSVLSDQHREIIKLHHAKDTELLKIWNKYFKRTIPGIVDLIYLESLRIADSYDAMTSNRVYKPKTKSPEEAVEDITKNMLFNEEESINILQAEYSNDDEYFEICYKKNCISKLEKNFYLGVLFSRDELKNQICKSETQNLLIGLPCHRPKRAASLHEIIEGIDSLKASDLAQLLHNLKKNNLEFMGEFAASLVSQSSTTSPL
jgi:hypothetical protein